MNQGNSATMNTRTDTTKHPAPAQPGLFFWAEATDGPGGLPMYAVVSQMKGYPATSKRWDGATEREAVRLSFLFQEQCLTPWTGFVLATTQAPQQ